MRILRQVALAGVLLTAQFADAPVLRAQDLAAIAAQGRNLLRAVRLLESGEMESGEVEVVAELAVAKGSATQASLLVLAPESGSAETSSQWLVTLVAPAVDSETLVEHRTVDWLSTTGAPGRSYFAGVSIPEDFQDVAVAVEELTTGRWGAVLVDLVDEISQSEPAQQPLAAVSEPVKPAAPAALSPQAKGGEVIKLIPPANRPAVGRVRFRTVVTMDGVRSAVFYLDGELAASDNRFPFSATLDLGATPRARVVRVHAIGARDLVLGSDEITVNLEQRPFAARILSLEPVAAGEGSVLVTAEVSVPPTEVLDRVEFYRNEELVTTLRRPPFEAAIEATGDTSDFVRVLAHLASGASVEDARLLSDRAVSERIEVNLVEVYAVVSDREGRPVDNLAEDSFRLRQGRREVPIERFALADEVPLVLGLIVDSSESMDFLMDDTKRAAARFLNQTVLDDDRAFLIDFDSQPRLAQGLTADVGVLASALSRVRVGGNTAIYDAIIYSLAQFEREPGRRALVLLTDGRDYGSKFGPKRCLAEARRLGVPVYIIAINDIFSRMPGAWMQKKPKKAPPPDAFLEGFSKDTGGRLFSITEIGELTEVYNVINAELRSQYLLAFSTAAPLSEKELRSIDVDVEGRGLSVRTVVLDR